MDKLRGYRNMIGYSQEQMAQELDVSKQTYNLKEQGKVEFKISEANKIVSVLNEAGIKIKYQDIFLSTG